MLHASSSLYGTVKFTAKKYYNVKKKQRTGTEASSVLDDDDSSTQPKLAYVNPILASKHMKGEFKMPSKHKRSRADKTFVTASGDVVTRKAGVGGDQVLIYDTNIVVRCLLLNMRDCETNQPITADAMFAKLPTVFSAMSFPSASVSMLDPRVTVSITANGKLCVTGGRAVDQCIIAIYLFRNHFARIFNAPHCMITDIRVVNRSAHGSIECRNKHVNLHKLYRCLQSKIYDNLLKDTYVKYDPSEFPGVLHWPKQGKKSQYVAYYGSGHYLITGSHTEEELAELDAFVRDLLSQFVENGACAKQNIEELQTQLLLQMELQDDEDSIMDDDQYTPDAENAIASVENESTLASLPNLPQASVGSLSTATEEQQAQDDENEWMRLLGWA